MDRTARVVADADVLAADLLVGGDAREAMDLVRAHSWVDLLATEALLADAERVVATLADDALATDWRATVADRATLVDPSARGHPALVAARDGDAAHLLSFDERLRSAAAGTTLREYVETSVKHPAAFARLFDPEALYPELFDAPYPGPDTDPRG